MTEKEFDIFKQNKQIYYFDDTVEKFYDNNYHNFNNATKYICEVKDAYYDNQYYYDEKLDIIIVDAFYIGD